MSIAMSSLFHPAIRSKSPLCIYANFETARKLVGDLEAARIWNRGDVSWPEILPILVPARETNLTRS